MKVKDIKIASFRLIAPVEDVLSDNIEELEANGNYAYYFNNMLPSINSAITRIVQECVLPFKKHEFDFKEYNKLEETDVDEDYYNVNKNYYNGEKKLLPKLKTKVVEFDLGKEVGDFYKLKYISYITPQGNILPISYKLIGNILQTDNQQNGKIVIYYSPKIDLLEKYVMLGVENSLDEIDLEEYGISDNIASIIPYYVKGDLLEHDKPYEATNSKNLFDQYLMSFEKPEINETNSRSKSWWGDKL